MTAPPISKRTWPKPYLLQLYAEAVTQGCIRVAPLSPADSKSLTQTFYRLRRRIDRDSRDYILPEYHLVTASAWQPDHGGCIYLIFSKAPDGEPPLPTISGVEAGFTLPTPAAAPVDNPAPDPILAGLELSVEDIDPADYLSALRAEAKAKQGA